MGRVGLYNKQDEVYIKLKSDQGTQGENTDAGLSMRSRNGVTERTGRGDNKKTGGQCLSVAEGKKDVE